MVGYSYGAYIFASVALKAPKVVERLVLIAPAAVFTPISPWFVFRAVFHNLVYSGSTGFEFENWHSGPTGNKDPCISPTQGLHRHEDIEIQTFREIHLIAYNPLYSKMLS